MHAATVPERSATKQPISQCSWIFHPARTSPSGTKAGLAASTPPNRVKYYRGLGFLGSIKL